MYQCPNCAANLKYNISKQALYCEYCETTLDPYSFHKEQNAEESREYEVVVFRCPQCGGELLTEDTTAATFCSFCGASTILDSRISMEKCPEYIIPFTKDKQDCINAYEKMMKHAFFVPRGLKDKEHIEKFRGIYMPFWINSYAMKEHVKFPASKKESKRRKKSDIDYTLKCFVDVKYKGFAHDASSSFADKLSDSILPYNFGERKKFTPSFLSGFYADTNDIERELYKNDDVEQVMQDASYRIGKEKGFCDYSINTSDEGELYKNLKFRPATQELALLPVWFLAYRKKDRVAYAIMNGQTGKMSADLPIATHKYLFSSLLLAVPIFFLLSMFSPMITPDVLLILCAILSFVCSVISNVQLSSCIVKENGETDKGIVDQKLKRGEKLTEKKKYAYILQKIVKVLFAVLWCLFIFCLFIILTGFFIYFMDKHPFLALFIAMDKILFIVYLVVFYFAAIQVVKWFSKRVLLEHYMYWNLKLPHLIKPLASVVIAGAIMFLNPKSEPLCYMGAMICMIMTAVTFIGIIKYHNRLTTRKLPQLGRRGGGEND